MFLVYCEEDHSYLILEEENVIFEDGIKNGDSIQFFHCNKLYTGSVIIRSDVESELLIWRKKKMEEDKEKAKASKAVWKSSPKREKRQRVPSVPYSPTTKAKQKIRSKSIKKQRQTRNNKKGKTSVHTYNTKTQQLNALFDKELLSSSSAGPSSDEDKSNKFDDDSDENNTPYDMVCNKEQNQETDVATSTLAELLKQLQEAEAMNAYLQNKLKAKRSLSPVLSSGFESLIDREKENEQVEFQKKAASVSINPMKHLEGRHLRDVNDINHGVIKHKKAVPKNMERILEKKLDGQQSQVSNVVLQHKLSEPQAKVISKQNSNEEIVLNTEEPSQDAGRQFEQLYGKDFNEDGERMVLLRDGVFCKSSTLSLALGSSSKTTHLVRRLVLGVYKKEIFKKGRNQVTLTGNAPRAAGRQLETQYCNIDFVAKSAIIKYAKAVGRNKKWPYVHTKDLERTFS